MRAAAISCTGPASQIQIVEMPKPVPGPNDVLVRVEAVAVNPIDTYIRAGVVKMELPLPWIPGCDVAGVVEAVGAEVTRFTAGDRVWGSNQSLFGRQGTFAEFCAIDEQWLYRTPAEVTSQQAAAGALTGITAHLGLHLHGGLRDSGEVLFVNGGSGGVGSVVIQLAKAAGATVITTAGTADKLAACRELGADEVINYREEDVDQRLAEIMERTGPVTFWWETLRTPTPDRTVAAMAKRGRIILMAGRDARPEFPVGPFYVKDLRLIGFAMFNASPAEQRAAADDLNRLMSAGKLVPRISRVMMLEEAAAAHQLQEDNTLSGAGTLSGKIVLTP
ncbi:MAG: NADPH:quinone reductase [Planctomycetaceae bacterium]|nr:NADPH:quinone reductase [Planctomycetaceae bacterium]